MTKFQVYFTDRRKKYIAVFEARDEEAARVRVIHNYPDCKINRVEVNDVHQD